MEKHGSTRQKKYLNMQLGEVSLSNTKSTVLKYWLREHTAHKLYIHLT